MKNSNIKNFLCYLLGITLIILICSNFYIQGSYGKIKNTSVKKIKNINKNSIPREYSYSDIFSSIQNNKNIQTSKIDYGMLNQGIIKMNLIYNGDEGDFCTELNSLEKQDFFRNIDEINLDVTGKSKITAQIEVELKKYK